MEWPPDWFGAGFAAVRVSGAIGGYVLVRRLENSLIHVGWALLILQTVVDFCGELTRNQAWDAWVETAVAVSAYLVLAVGLVRSQGSLESVAARFKRQEEQLRHDANHDRLTGLANRSYFLDELAIRWREAPAADRSRMAVLFIDLDGFKAVNDEFGHLVGDELLQVVGRRLKAAVRGDDLVARVGGDEFASLVSGLADDETLEHLVQRVQERLAPSVVINGVRIAPRASIGVARGADGHVRPKDLLRAADAAMYAAKRAKLGPPSPPPPPPTE